MTPNSGNPLRAFHDKQYGDFGFNSRHFDDRELRQKRSEVEPRVKLATATFHSAASRNEHRNRAEASIFKLLEQSIRSKRGLSADADVTVDAKSMMAKAQEPDKILRLRTVRILADAIEGLPKSFMSSAADSKRIGTALPRKDASPPETSFRRGTAAALNGQRLRVDLKALEVGAPETVETGSEPELVQVTSTPSPRVRDGKQGQVRWHPGGSRSEPKRCLDALKAHFGQEKQGKLTAHQLEHFHQKLNELVAFVGVHRPRLLDPDKSPMGFATLVSAGELILVSSHKNMPADAAFYRASGDTSLFGALSSAGRHSIQG